MKTRREFVAAVAAWPILAFTGAARAQSKKLPVLIGWFHADSRESSAQNLDVFKEGLAVLGWKEGLNYVLEERWADGQFARLQPLAEDLSAKKPAVIVAAPSMSIGPMAKAAPNTPIVMASGSDPVAAGLVNSLARPGGLITGVTNVGAAFAEKYIELLLAAAPKVKRVGVLAGFSKIDLQKEAVRRSVAHYKVAARFAEANSPEEVDLAIARLVKEGAQALIVLQFPILRVERRRIMKLALAQRWPVISGTALFVEEGALITYSHDVLANYRRAAYYVDRILKGVKPGGLPMEQSTKFELAINMKTARMLKLEIPRELAVRADRVIE